MSRFQAHLAEAEGSDRSFGLLLGAVFLAIGFLRLWKGGGIRWWAVGVATLLMLLAVVAPTVLRQPKRAWLFLGFLLSLVVNPIVLSFLFFFVVTPAGLLMRLCGCHPLCLRTDPEAPTYWRTRTEPPSDMRRQF